MPPTSLQTPKKGSDKAPQDTPLLRWRVHLLRREPNRLPTLVAVLILAALCVWLMFHALLPTLAAVVLLVGACNEYLFPVRYRLTAEGVFAEGATSRLALQWHDVRRCLSARTTLTLTPLPEASRLDAFRGVTLRFAPDGEAGDRASVLAAVAYYAPDVLSPSPHDDTSLPVSPQSETQAQRARPEN